MEEDSSTSFFPSLQHSRTRKANTSSRLSPWRWEIKAKRHTERHFVLFLNTWEWLQNYWEWHWKHSGEKKSPKYTSKLQLAPPRALPSIRLGRDVFCPSAWAGSCPQPGKPEGGAEAMKGWTPTALSCKGCACWEPLWVMSKDSAFYSLSWTPNSHYSLANFRRNLFKMWEQAFPIVFWDLCRVGN